jgi:hypothetical protein
VSTSVAYLRKRLADIGRDDLLSAAEAGLISTFAAAEEAGLVRRKEVLGTGSPNAAKRRAWALMRVTGKSPLRPLKPEPRPEPEFSPESVRPKFSQETRDIIARLVEAGRADLVIAVTERRISPFQAARIADRGDGRRRTVCAHVELREELPSNLRAEIDKVDEAPKPKKLDVRALIG